MRLGGRCPPNPLGFVALGRRPVEWLVDNIGLDARWCVIHATHTTEREIQALAASGAVVGLCPLTEASERMRSR